METLLLEPFDLLASPRIDRGTSGTCSEDSSVIDESLYHLSQDVANDLVVTTEVRMENILEMSSFVRCNCRIHEIPQLSQEDFSIGPLLAKGGFSSVHLITAFEPGSNLDDEESTKRGKEYVAKSLSPKLTLNTKRLLSGARDLVKEAHFLSSLDHENIIQLRGWAKDGIASYATSGRADGFFLIYERLDRTMSQELHRWYMEDREARTTKQNKIAHRKTSLMERLEVVLGVAKALAYLHKHHIVHMDVKPGNVGFDTDGVVKLFDFGLAAELPPSDDPNETFALPNHTGGTPRFMAPEIINKAPFNCKADVFSFAIFLWETLALKKPYDGYTGDEVKQFVVLFDDRPDIPRSFPRKVKKLLRRSWCRRISLRPTMEEICEILSNITDPTPKPTQRRLSWFNRQTKK